MNRYKRPEIFKGHSMSVSDIIEAPYGLWYCDSIEFKRIQWSMEGGENGKINLQD
jgi:hypothetical protein